METVIMFSWFKKNKGSDQSPIKKQDTSQNVSQDTGQNISQDTNFDNKVEVEETDEKIEIIFDALMQYAAEWSWTEDYNPVEKQFPLKEMK
jgi:hypothetical protein